MVLIFCIISLVSRIRRLQLPFIDPTFGVIGLGRYVSSSGLNSVLPICNATCVKTCGFIYFA